MTFVQIHNCETGEITIRELTNKEIKDRENDEKLRIKEAEAKEAARQAILDRLGLTADELQTILG